MPIVFSGVNRTVLEHGLEGAPNITGVLEREHVAESLRLLRAVVPGARRLAMVSDPSAYWDAWIGHSVFALPRAHGTAVPYPDLGQSGVAADHFRASMSASARRLAAGRPRRRAEVAC